MRRVWAMPDPCTFNIPPIRALVKSYLHKSKVSVDPFARNKRWATHTNDLNPETAAEHHIDAEEFLFSLRDKGVNCDLALFDPPYSPRQMAECYASIGKIATTEDTQNAALYRRVRHALSQILTPDAVVINCGWNSSGMGTQYHMGIIEFLIVCHGSGHNDTIVTVERKIEDRQLSLISGKAQVLSPGNG